MTDQDFADFERLCNAYAKAQAQATFLDDFSKSLLAKLMKAAEASGATSAAIQEREARRDGEYLRHLEGKRAATEQALALRWKMTLWQARLDWLRTEAANARRV